MINNSFTKAVADVLALAEARCKENPECQHMTIQRDELARVIAREERVEAELKARKDLAAKRLAEAKAAAKPDAAAKA